MATNDDPKASPIDQWKEKGNQLFKEGKFKEAAVEYSRALKEDPTNHALLSNRSAAFLGMARYQAALTDAEKCIAAKPDWSKGSPGCLFY